MNKNELKTFLLLSGAVCVLICLGSYTGLTTPDFYNKETPNWKVQSIGQDMINLFLICPFLLLSACMVFLRKKYGPSLWAGTLLYLIYTYLIYCFNIHFNNYFISYCFTLGICFYLFIYFIYFQIRNPQVKFQEKKTDKVNAFYFMIIAVLFYFIWLLDLLPAIHDNTIPNGVREGGLFTNPVQIIDLSVFLPGIFITGILLLKNKTLGHVFAPILLTFFTLMDISIAFLSIVMVNEGVGSGYGVAYVMLFLAVLSLILLVRNLKTTIR